jgi:hypothetical protein
VVFSDDVFEDFTSLVEARDISAYRFATLSEPDCTRAPMKSA